MKKNEFLSQLREWLAFELPESMVRSNLSYYDGYIDEERRKGRSVEEILDELGDPALIARTIIDAAKSGADGIPYTDDDNDYAGEIFGGAGSGSDQGGSAGSASYGGGDYREDSYGSAQSSSGSYQKSSSTGSAGGWNNINLHTYNTGCLGCLLWIIIGMTVLSVIGTIIGVLTPILIPVCLVLLMIWMLRNMFGGGSGSRW